MCHLFTSFILLKIYTGMSFCLRVLVLILAGYCSIVFLQFFGPEFEHIVYMSKSERSIVSVGHVRVRHCRCSERCGVGSISVEFSLHGYSCNWWSFWEMRISLGVFYANSATHKGIDDLWHWWFQNGKGPEVAVFWSDTNARPDTAHGQAVAKTANFLPLSLYIVHAAIQGHIVLENDQW